MAGMCCRPAGQLIGQRVSISNRGTAADNPGTECWSNGTRRWRLGPRPTWHMYMYFTSDLPTSFLMLALPSLRRPLHGRQSASRWVCCHLCHVTLGKGTYIMLLGSPVLQLCTSAMWRRQSNPFHCLQSKAGATVCCSTHMHETYLPERQRLSSHARLC